MPAPATLNDLLDLSHKSGLIDQQTLASYRDRLRGGKTAPGGPKELAEAMVRDGLLTHFQAEQLLMGRWKNFRIGGKYRLLERLGEGGMGAVFLCEHVHLKRRVAIKILPQDQAKDESVVERFYREGRAVAALDHPNIVKVHDIDHDGRLHFLVMEFVDGASLYEIVKRKGPMDWFRACHYVCQSALGLQHAHEAAGIVHRDVKPGNLLLDRTGTIKVLDLGLARFFHDDRDNLTSEHSSQAILGTADYIAPEQVESSQVDIRADVYGLGMSFYFLLAGRGPFAEGTLSQKLIWHQTRRPRPVAELRDDVPARVLAVLEKMIAKSPDDRYQTPHEVVEALETLVATPIPPPPDDEMPLLSRAALGSGPGSNGSDSSGATMTRTSPVSTNSTMPGIRRQTPTPTPTRRVRKEALVKEPGGKANPLANVEAPSILQRLRKQKPRAFWGTAAGGAALLALLLALGLVWAFSGKKEDPTPNPRPGPHRDAVGLVATLQGHTSNVERVALNAEGTLALSCSHDHTLRLWDLKTNRLLRTLAGHTRPVHDCALTADGLLAASAGYDNLVILWDTQTGKEVGRLTGHTAEVRAVAFSPDGERLISGAGSAAADNPLDCTIRLWDVRTRKQIRQFKGHTDAVWGLAFAADGHRFVSGSYDQTARVWDVDNGNEVTRFTAHTGTVHAVALSPDGTRAASASADRTVRVWRTDNAREERVIRGHSATVAAVAYSPDGTRLLTGSDDRTLRHWDVATGRELDCFSGHAGQVWGVAFTPDGKRAVSASADNTLKVWAFASR